MPVHQSLVARVMKAASDVNLKLDIPLIDIEVRGKITRITAPCATSPDSYEASRWMKSALYIVIQEEFSNLPSVEINITIPRVVSKSLNREHTSQWIVQQIQGVSEWATLCTQMLTKAAYEHVIERYPWKKAGTMRLLLPVLCMQSLTNVQNGVHDDPMQGNVDQILPPINEAMSACAQFAIVDEVTCYLDQPPSSLLEVYESVYDMVRNDNERSEVVDQLYHHLFAW